MDSNWGAYLNRERLFLPLSAFYSTVTKYRPVEPITYTPPSSITSTSMLMGYIILRLRLYAH